MRYRIGILAMAAAVALAAAPPAAHATPPDSSVIAQRTPPALASTTAPESIRVFLVTQLEVPQALAVDSAQLRAHEQRAILATMAGLNAARVPVRVGMVFERESDGADPARLQCGSDSLPAVTRPPNRAAGSARASILPTSLIHLARR